MKAIDVTIKAVDVWGVENMQANLEKAIAYLDLLVDTYGSMDTYDHFTAKDGEKLALLLTTGRELVEAICSQADEIINEAYGK